MKKILGCILLLFTSFLHSQELQLVLHSTQVNSGSSYVSKDHLDALYEVHQNELTKTDGTQLWRYENPFLGAIAYVDVRNPLQLLVFYHSTNSVVFLDNQLSEMQSIALSTAFPELNVKYLSLASKNKLWFFDAISKRVGQLDMTQLKVNYLTQPLEETLLQWASDANAFYWTDANYWYSVDQFAKINQVKLPFSGQHVVGLSSDYVFYNTDHALYAYSLKTHNYIDLKFNTKSAASFFLNHQNLTIFTTPEIFIYNLKEQ